jgi:hypothetical protein
MPRVRVRPGDCRFRTDTTEQTPKRAAVSNGTVAGRSEGENTDRQSDRIFWQPGKTGIFKKD